MKIELIPGNKDKSLIWQNNSHDLYENIIIVRVNNFFAVNHIYPLLRALTRKLVKYRLILLDGKKKVKTKFDELIVDCFQLEFGCSLEQAAFSEEVLASILSQGGNKNIYLVANATEIGPGSWAEELETAVRLCIDKYSLTSINNILLAVSSESLFLTAFWPKDNFKWKGRCILSVNTFIDDRARSLCSGLNIKLLIPTTDDSCILRENIVKCLQIKKTELSKRLTEDLILITPRPWGDSYWKDGLYSCEGGEKSVSQIVSYHISKYLGEKKPVIIKGDLRSAGQNYIQVLKDTLDNQGFEVYFSRDLYSIAEKYKGIVEPDLGTLLMSGIFEDSQSLFLYAYDSGAPVDLTLYQHKRFQVVVGAELSQLDKYKFNQACIDRMKLRCEWAIADCMLGELSRKLKGQEYVSLGISGYTKTNEFIEKENVGSEGGSRKY